MPTVCGLELMSTIRTKAYEYSEELLGRLESGYAMYQECRMLPSYEQLACMQQYARYVIGLIQGLEPEFEIKRTILRYYAIDRLDDYYTCRTNNGTEVEAGSIVLTPHVLCAEIMYENTKDALKPYTDMAVYQFNVVYDQFYYCVSQPESMQPTCLRAILRKTIDVAEKVWEQMAELRPMVVQKTMYLLEDYYQCRIR